MLNVMIAEDNVPVSVHLSNDINTKDVRCIDIENEGTKVYRKIKELKPDLLVLDLKMPGKNGIQILEEMTNDKEIKTEVIIYSGENEYMTLVKNYECVTMFISKFTPTQEVGRRIQLIANEKSNKKIENKVSDILMKLGFSYAMKGTRLISDCIIYSIKQNTENINDIYKYIEEQKKCNIYTIKSDIYTAINAMWKYTDKEKTRKILRLGECDKPSAKLVISMTKYYIER